MQQTIYKSLPQLNQHLEFSSSGTKIGTYQLPSTALEGWLGGVGRHKNTNIPHSTSNLTYNNQYFNSSTAVVRRVGWQG